MAKGPQRIRGTQDIWGVEADRFGRVVEAFDRVRRLYAFQRVEMPVFEDTQVFARSIGETTDIVSKEMYTFPDRGGDSLTLRPEFTAGICRAYLSEGWQQLQRQLALRLGQAPAATRRLCSRATCSACISATPTTRAGGSN